MPSHPEMEAILREDCLQTHFWRGVTAVTGVQTQNWRGVTAVAGVQKRVWRESSRKIATISRVTDNLRRGLRSFQGTPRFFLSDRLRSPVWGGFTPPITFVGRIAHLFGRRMGASELELIPGQRPE